MVRGRGKSDLSKSATEMLIDEWILNERDRRILKRRLLDEIHYQPLAEEFDLSISQIKRIIYRGCDIIFNK